MREFDRHMARVAECEQRAKGARSDDDRQSWLAMADSWRHTADLAKILERHGDLIERAIA